MRMGREGRSVVPSEDWLGGLPGAGEGADAAALAKRARAAWVKDTGEGRGERDYAPGYAQLLEGDLVFGDPDTDPDSRARARCVGTRAQAIHGLIMLGDGDPIPANASQEAA